MRFCGFSATEETPERTAFVRFRKARVGTAALDRKLTFVGALFSLLEPDA